MAVLRNVIVSGDGTFHQLSKFFVKMLFKKY